jgi:hypothetical protein
MKHVRKRVVAGDEAATVAAAAGAVAVEIAVVAAGVVIAGIRDPTRQRAIWILRQSPAQNYARN